MKPDLSYEVENKMTLYTVSSTVYPKYIYGGVANQCFSYRTSYNTNRLYSYGF